MNEFNNLSEMLLNNGITPSVQRIKILEYLLTKKNHPTADQLFSDLQSNIHSLSKATVYNTLALFAEKGLIKVLSFENNENRYDITASHGHFVCKSCKAIYDFEINVDSRCAQGLDGFVITDRNVCFKGLCPKCQAKEE